ncbi:MAG: DUF6051 family protein [Desulfovibrio sp.]|jgi:hypothetical protein|nr:DUF6051 family protein [Desulfovibrio sp.]
MLYRELYAQLKGKADFRADQVSLGCGLVMRNYDFRSRIRISLGAGNPPGDESPPGGLEARVDRPDEEIEENLRFRYPVLLPEGVRKAGRMILLLHGLNEKQWDKYLPWAAHVAARTGKAVVLFPIAFHMNRAPALWSDPRAMHRLAGERKAKYPLIRDSSLSNVALSIRLQRRPLRFVQSGLQSYYDILDLADTVRRGEHPALEAEAGIDILSYSIGAFLGEILMMTNANGYFSQSRYAAFCGGPVFNRLSPVSKFILDSEADVRLYSCLQAHLEGHMRGDPSVRRVFDGSLEEGLNFRSLLTYRKDLPYREEKLRAMRQRLYAVALARDEVAPAYEVAQTLRGSRGDLGVRVDRLDYPYPYRHEDPFPLHPGIAREVDACFRKTFDRISGFLR